MGKNRMPKLRKQGLNTSTIMIMRTIGADPNGYLMPPAQQNNMLSFKAPAPKPKQMVANDDPKIVSMMNNPFSSRDNSQNQKPTAEIIGFNAANQMKQANNDDFSMQTEKSQKLTHPSTPAFDPRPGM